MVFAWKAAGLTYNRYLAVAGRVVRRSLKEDKRIAAERRGEMDLRFAKWENGKMGDQKPLAEANILRCLTETSSRIWESRMHMRMRIDGIDRKDGNEYYSATSCTAV
ncbi:mitochondrial ATP synthase epsilon chain-domain-containing protein [Hypoxylon trugodes]|uniref:mitochondrial ATP synthase epsilon chain-domain-containing protein n=1 Tax=Hypoxylon trugodes TaxID=326681 RepID=UPI002199205B|nr:mitochondrial ATP synthase epsilon chain-domain-containing protein [Hypoxylon trugodes]KAI1382763.1 mitochondrial ATP synthase epsilon chain-domain-containing protein [Hypoxylon trugodes]